MIGAMQGGILRVVQGALLAATMSLLLVLGRAVEAAPAWGATNKPNFVLLQVDDLSMSVLRARVRTPRGMVPLMPATRSLLTDRGVTFDRFYSNNPICGPSRASLLSGLTTHNHGVTINVSPWGYDAWENSPRLTDNLPLWLDGLGYRTVHVGKFMNGYGARDGSVPGWDSWVTSVNNGGAPYYGYSLNRNGRIIGPFGRYSEKDPWDCNVALPGSYNACMYSGDVQTAYAIDEIEKSAGQPFFLSVDFNAPHDDGRGRPGPEPPTRYRQIADRVHAPMPADDPTGNPTKPNFIRDLPAMTPDIDLEARRRFRFEAASMRGVDDSIARIIEALALAGQLRNTYVMFFSDNGFFHGEHRIAYGKFLPHEPSTRQPLIVRGPGIAARSNSEALAGTIDLAPTVVDLAGGRPWSQVDGRSIARYALRPTARSPYAIPLEGFNGRGIDDPGPFTDGIGGNAPNQALVLNYTGFVAGRWKYVRYYYGDEELYDLTRDPAENWNLARNPRFGPVLDWAGGVTDWMANCHGPAACRPTLSIPERPGR